MIFLALVDFNDVSLQLVTIKEILSTKTTRGFFSVVKLNVIREFFFAASGESFAKRTFKARLVIMNALDVFYEGRQAFNAFCMIAMSTTEPLML